MTSYDDGDNLPVWPPSLNCARLLTPAPDAAPTLGVDRSVAAPGHGCPESPGPATPLRAVTIFTTSRCSPGLVKNAVEQQYYQENFFKDIFLQIKKKK